MEPASGQSTFMETTRETTWTPPPALIAGPEMEALKKFMSDCDWIGSVQAGGMGQGSPEMEATGKGRFTPIMDGVWLVGDFEQNQYVSGNLLIIWKMHFIVGWNPTTQSYKIALVDNNGTADLMSGRIEGNRFMAENSPGGPVRLELVWELVGDGTIKWTNRCSINEGPWFVVEEYICTPV
ncbi:MAG TPA: DUF1579 family protein [Chloroflexia bacterium]|nr:DUF1579 family protein [Chloroflexia bacterium]